MNSMRIHCKLRVCLRQARFLAWSGSTLLLTVGSARPAEPPVTPVPKSPYLGVVYKFADTLLEHARDDFGPEKTGLFLSALDRASLKPLGHHPAAPTGVREGDRVGREDGPLTGANVQHDENLLRLLYVLSALSSQPKYAAAADNALRWFLQHAASPQTSLLPWGEHLYWDVMRDEPMSPRGEAIHEFFRPWLLWGPCFELAPEPSKRFALGLWHNQIADKTSGAFDRHAFFDKALPADGFDFPRHAGYFLRTWAEAYQRTQDPELLRAIEVITKRFEEKRGTPDGLIRSSHQANSVWPASNLSLAIDMDGISGLLPGPVRARLRTWAAEEDDRFIGLPHALAARGGFVAVWDAQARRPESFTSLWETRYGQCTTAQVGMMCVARYDNRGRTAYRDLLRQCADVYLGSEPSETEDLWPVVLGHAISLQVAAWRHFADPAYLAKARTLADWAVAHFWGDLALPKASLRADHYESITGADSLALALVELHMQLLAITAVRYPPNTLDR